MAATNSDEQLLARLVALEKENTDVKEQNSMYCRFFQLHCDNQLQKEKFEFQKKYDQLNKDYNELVTQRNDIHLQKLQLDKEYDDLETKYRNLRERVDLLKLEFSVCFAKFYFCVCLIFIFLFHW